MVELDYLELDFYSIRIYRLSIQFNNGNTYYNVSILIVLYRERLMTKNNEKQSFTTIVPSGYVKIAIENGH